MATTYKIAGERLVLPDKLDFLNKEQGISILRDISYRVSGKTFGFRSEREKARGYFLVKLIDKYKYPESCIELDKEVVGFDDADMVVHKDGAPFIVIECEKSKLSESEKDRALKELFDKAFALNSEYAVLVAGSEFTAFKVKPRMEKVLDIPVKK